MSDIEKIINDAWENKDQINPNSDKKIKDTINQIIADLDSGKVRVAEKINGEWVTHQHLKKAIMLSFRIYPMENLNGPYSSWYDKAHLLKGKTAGWTKEDHEKAGFRMVPNSPVRKGSFVGKNAVLMPCYVNIGAYIDEGTMIDTFARAGSCSQIGKNCHISAASGVGGVLEPAQALPTIIEDNVFLGAMSEVVEGVIVGEGSVISMGMYIGKSTKTIAFQFLQDDLAKTIYSPDDLFAIHSSPNSVLDKTGIALFSEDYNSNIVNNNIQMSSEYHVFPYQKAFNQPITLEFSNISFDDDLWKYQIKNKQNEEWIEIESSIKDGKIFADAMFGGIYSVFYNPEAKSPVPEKFELVNLYPNPFNPTLTIQYNLDSKQNVSIDIYNILGQKVNRLLNQEVSIGYHSINWNGTNDSGIALGSGIYFVKISTNDESYIRKVTLLK